MSSRLSTKAWYSFPFPMLLPARIRNIMRERLESFRVLCYNIHTVNRRVQADLKPVNSGNILATIIPDKSEQTDNKKNVNTTDNGFLTKMFNEQIPRSSGNKNICWMNGLTTRFIALLSLPWYYFDTKNIVRITRLLPRTRIDAGIGVFSLGTDW